jgi:hypothetical protein
MSRIRCGHCGGRGTVPLSDEYAATLGHLRLCHRDVSGAEMGRLMGVAATAMNNRLAKLEEFGLATSRVSGRQRLYTATGGTS